jgi:acetyl esterase/lipase
VTELPFLRPFVLPHEPVDPVRAGELDLYLPTATPAPAVVLVHGGPVPAGLPQRPPVWPAYRGYGSLLAAAGVVGVMLEHSYRAPGDVDAAAADVRRLVAAARAEPAVDADRVVLWFFSGGGVLAGEWLADPPAWLRGVALTYPVVRHFPDVPSALVTPLDVADRLTVPVLVTRVEREHGWLAPSQADFLAAAGPAVDLLDVPGAEHGFETLTDTPATRTAITDAVTWAATHARG